MKNVSKLVTILSLLLFCGATLFGYSVAVAGTTYYFSSSQGSDDNDGITPGSPWKTFHPVYTKCIYGPHFAPGDSLLLKRGDTWANLLRILADGSETDPIVIGSYGDGPPPLLRGHIAPASWDSVAGHPGVYSTAIEMGTQFATIFEGPTRLEVVPSGDLDLLDSTDVDTYLDSFTPGSFGPPWTATGRNSNGNTDIIWLKSLDGTSPDSVIVFWHAPVNVLRGSSYITIENLELTESEFAIDIEGSDHIVVRNNSISEIYDLGVYLRWDNTNCLVENNDITRTGNNALYILTGSDNTLRGNTISYVIDSVLGIPTGGDQCGIGLQESSNNLVEYNEISYIKSQGVDFYRETGTTMRYNYFYHLGQGSVPYGTDLRIHNNIFDVDWQPGGNGRGMNVVNTGGGTILVYNNVFYRVSAGISVSTAEDSVVYRNNIVYSINPDDWLIWAVNDNVYSDYNLFFGSERIRAASGVWYTSLADYQATGHEPHSFLDEPDFVSTSPASPSEFCLSLWSPAIDKGEDLKVAGLIGVTDPYLDYAGAAIPQGAAPDIGAYESEALSAVATPHVPRASLLEQNVPNPFGPVTDIRFAVAEPGRVRLTIYDVKGSSVRVLIDEMREADRYVVTWDGRNDSGAEVPSGVYFCKLEVGSLVATRKMVLFR